MRALRAKERKGLRVIEEKLQDWGFPPQVVVELTAFCNFRCVHCNHKDMRRIKGSMSEGLFEKIINEIVEVNPDTEVWPTFYGEAFVLGDRLFKYLYYAKQQGARNLVLNSNGSLLYHKDWIDQTLTCGLKRFVLSLDGFTASTFESIRIGGKRDRIFASVERLLQRKKDLGLEYPVIQCQFSIMEQNRHEFSQFKAFWEALGAEVKSRNMLSWTNSGPVRANNLEYGSSFRIACPWGNNTMAIHYNGDVVACAVDYEGRFIAGTASEKSLKEIWNGPHYEKLRLKHRQHKWDEIPKVCKSCPDWQAVGAQYHDSGGTVASKKYSRPFWFTS